MSGTTFLGPMYPTIPHTVFSPFIQLPRFAEGHLRLHRLAQSSSRWRPLAGRDFLEREVTAHELEIRVEARGMSRLGCAETGVRERHPNPERGTPAMFF